MGNYSATQGLSDGREDDVKCIETDRVTPVNLEYLIKFRIEILQKEIHKLQELDKLLNLMTKEIKHILTPYIQKALDK